MGKVKCFKRTRIPTNNNCGFHCLFEKEAGTAPVHAFFYELLFNDSWNRKKVSGKTEGHSVWHVVGDKSKRETEVISLRDFLEFVCVNCFHYYSFWPWAAGILFFKEGTLISDVTLYDPRVCGCFSSYVFKFLFISKPLFWNVGILYQIGWL